MAPLPIIADTFRVALNWNGNNVCNVIHIHAPSSTAVNVRDLMENNVSANMWKSQINFYEIVSLDITPLSGTLATQTFNITSAAKWKGSSSGTELIPNTAAVLSFKTIFRGAAHRGRLYLGPVAESVADSGTIGQTLRNDIAAAWQAFGAGIIDDGAEHVVASYKNSTAATVLNYSVRSVLGTQRRRQDRMVA